MSNDFNEKVMGYVETLKKRYEGASVKPASLEELVKENPDIPIRVVSTYIKNAKICSNPEAYFIDQGIIRDSEVVYCRVVVCSEHTERYYIAEPGLQVQVGTYVVVPFNGEDVIGVVRTVEKYSSANVPYTSMKVNTITRLATENEVYFGEASREEGGNGAGNTSDELSRYGKYYKVLSQGQIADLLEALAGMRK